MSVVLGYKFSRTHVRDNAYRPISHNEYDNIDLQTKQGIHQLLQRDALPVRFVDLPQVQTAPPKLAPEIAPDAPNAQRL